MSRYVVERDWGPGKRASAVITVNGNYVHIDMNSRMDHVDSRHVHKWLQAVADTYYEAMREAERNV